MTMLNVEQFFSSPDTRPFDALRLLRAGPRHSGAQLPFPLATPPLALILSHLTLWTFDKICLTRRRRAHGEKLWILDLGFWIHDNDRT
jgi:hypothetical protein